MSRRDRMVAWAFLGLFILTSLIIRIDGIDVPSLEFHATRQFRSALIAHSFYTGEAQAIDEDVAADPIEAGGEPRELELPIGETIAAGLYDLFGGEKLWLPRLVCILAWLAGGIFLFAAAREIGGAAAGLVATSLYLFLPFGVEASRSFQPDPIMLALIVAALWAMLRHFAKPTGAALLRCGLLAAAAVVVKPVALLFLGPSFLALSVSRQGVRRTLLDPSVYILMAFLLLSAAYYLYQIAAGSALQAQAGRSMLPELLATREFWGRWVIQADEVVPLPLLALGLIASIVTRSPFRLFLLSLWLGYLGLGLVFTKHISTHDYYSLPLIPIIGLALAPAVARIWDVIRPRLPRPGLVIAAILGMAALAAMIVYWHRHWQSTREPALAQIAGMREIGEIVGHSANTIILADDFGKPLMYFGRLEGRVWPNVRRRPPGLTTPELFADRNRKAQADYFIVVDMKELRRQPDLEQFLRRRFALVAEAPLYLVFDLRKSL